MGAYHRKKWRQFYEEVIELDGRRCAHCGRGSSEGAVLRVHHKQYPEAGRWPWECPYDYCETLCKGCHASEHGIIRPFVGWVYVGDEDLGDLLGECDLCGRALRYAFHVEHARWPPMTVGTVCCDELTDTTRASDKRRLEQREERFLTSSRWRQDEGGSHSIKQGGATAVIEPHRGAYRILANGVVGKLRFNSADEAKKHLFAVLADGKFQHFVQKMGRRSVRQKAAS